MKQRLIYILTLLLTLFSCADDKERGIPGGSSDEKTTPLVFNVNLPTPTQPRTFALDNADESNVGTIHVLVFKDNAGTFQLADWAEAVPGSIQDNGSSNKKKFTVNFTRLKKNSDQYQFVLLANAKTQVDQLFDDGVAVGTEKSTTLARLEVKGVNRWITNSTKPDYKDIPMWGESSVQTVQDNMSIAEVKLLRMIAKVNVTIDIAAQPKFKLKQVDIYNYYKDGRLVPDPANLVGLTMVNNPTSLGTFTKGPIVYSAGTTNGEITDIGLAENIYIFESKVPVDGGNNPELDKMTCLVIGGVFDTDTRTTYYRLDFATKVGNIISYKDILRNYIYQINIIKVGGRGYDTSEEAFKARAINIEAEVVTWDSGSMPVQVWDGQYNLSVSAPQINIYKEAKMGVTFTASTNYPPGWTYEVKDAFGQAMDPVTGWLNNVSGSFTSINTEDIISFNVSANDEYIERTAFIYLKAGRMNYGVRVVQSIESDFNIYITDGAGNALSELIFDSHVGELSVPAQILNIQWGPADRNAVAQQTQTGNLAFNFSGGDLIPASIAAGQQQFSIQPPAMTAGEVAVNPQLEKSSRVDFQITNGLSFKTKSLYIRQINYGLLTNQKENGYVMDGSRYSFTIKANSNWTATWDAGADALINTPLGFEGVKGTQLAEFTAVSRGVNRADATLTFTSKANPAAFAPQTITIKGVLPIIQSADTWNPSPAGEINAAMSVTSNTDKPITAAISGVNTSWLSVTKVSQTGKEAKFRLETSGNLTQGTRTATITYTNGITGVAKTTIVSQTGATLKVTPALANLGYEAQTFDLTIEASTGRDVTISLSNNWLSNSYWVVPNKVYRLTIPSNAANLGTARSISITFADSSLPGLTATATINQALAPYIDDIHPNHLVWRTLGPYIVGTTTFYTANNQREDGSYFDSPHPQSCQSLGIGWRLHRPGAPGEPSTFLALRPALRRDVMFGEITPRFVPAEPVPTYENSVFLSGRNVGGNTVTVCKLNRKNVMWHDPYYYRLPGWRWQAPGPRTTFRCIKDK